MTLALCEKEGRVGVTGLEITGVSIVDGVEGVVGLLNSTGVSPELPMTLGVFLLDHSDLFLSSEDDGWSTTAVSCCNDDDEPPFLPMFSLRTCSGFSQNLLENSS